MKKSLIYATALLLLASCAGGDGVKTASGLDPENFISEVDGKPTALYVLKNSRGMEACITNYGGRLVFL